MKKRIIAANFKMNKTNKDIESYFDIFARNINELKNKGSFDDAEIVFAPPFTALCETYKIIKPLGGFIKLSSQNIYYEKSGAYTGEISLDMIKNCGCVYVIVGHSERRNIFNESDELIAKKIRAVYNYDNEAITPILCVGENLEIRNKNEHENFVKNQLNIALNSIKGKKTSSLIIAYEPIWAIGTGIPIKPDDGEEMHGFIYDYVNANFLIDELRIIYGGSVTESNIKELIAEKHIDGVLVGGASLDPLVFFNICKLSAV